MLVDPTTLLLPLFRTTLLAVVNYALGTSCTRFKSRFISGLYVFFTFFVGRRSFEKSLLIMCCFVSFGCGVVSVSTLNSLLRIPVVTYRVGCFSRCACWGAASSPVTTTTRSSLLAESFTTSWWIVLSSCRSSRDA